MKISKVLIVGLLCSSIFVTSCGKEMETDQFVVNDSEKVTEKSIETDKDVPVEKNIGTLTHGVDWSEDEKDYSFHYDGGVLEITYSMIGSGIGTSTGFLIYLDGVPQPYMIKDVEEEYKFMHVIEGEENQEKKFIISFVPVKGKAGDKVHLSINSIVNPSFVPDMKKTFEYGMSHHSIEALYTITFNQDTETIPEISDDLRILSNVSNEQVDIDKEEKAYIQEKSLELELDLDKEVHSDLIMDEKSMLLDRKIDISGKDSMRVSYIVMGHPGVRYKVNFYLDHQLLTDVSGKVYEMELATGKMNTIAFDMDISAVTNGSFYAVMVPVNADDYPEDGIIVSKYDSIHLYRGEN